MTRSDVRGEPDELRRRNFHMGWKAATNGEQYKPEALKRLTWQNVGWRLGSIFPETSQPMREELFEWCARQFVEKGQAPEE